MSSVSCKFSALKLGSGEVKYGLMMTGPKGQVFRTYDTSSFRKALKNKQKQLLPRFDFWQTGNATKMVIADFDKLPQDFDSWTSFREYLKWLYPNGIVLTSPSGKAKVLFKIEVPEEYTEGDDDKFAYTILNDTLKHLLNNDELYNLVDKSAPAMRILFTNAQMYDAILDKIYMMPVYSAIIDSVPSDLDSTYNWVSIPATTPELESLYSDLDSPAMLYVIQFLAGWSKQALQGIQLPQSYIAQQSIIDPNSQCPVSLCQVHYAIKSLIERGWLTLVSASYRVGHKAKTYVATGRLKSFLQQILSSFFKKSETTTRNRSGINGRTIVFSINDGEWNVTLWKMTNFFRTGEDFMSWFYSLAGWNRKDRERQARNAWFNHKKLDLAY